MGKLVLLPISIGGGLLAGLIGKNFFGVIWGLIDDQDPPKPEHRSVHVGKSLPTGSRSAATGRERKTARHCFSTSAATG
jgi:hypothetical protein